MSPTLWLEGKSDSEDKQAVFLGERGIVAGIRFDFSVNKFYTLNLSLFHFLLRADNILYTSESPRDS